MANFNVAVILTAAVRRWPPMWPPPKSEFWICWSLVLKNWVSLYCLWELILSGHYSVYQSENFSKQERPNIIITRCPTALLVPIPHVLDMQGGSGKTSFLTGAPSGPSCLIIPVEQSRASILSNWPGRGERGRMEWVLYLPDSGSGGEEW